MPRSHAEMVETRSPVLTVLARSLDAAADRIGEGDVLQIAPPDFGTAPAGDVADVVAAAGRLVAAVQRSHALEAAVHELFEAMSSHLRLDYLSCEALYRVIDHTGASGGAVVLIGDGPPDVVASVEFEVEDDRLAALMHSAAIAPGPCQMDVPERIVAVPFVGDSGPLGAVFLLGAELDSELRRLLALLARALGFAVSNAIAHAAVETQAAVDPLTGCSNRRAGLEALAQAARVAGHGGPTVSTLMIDLDHFKRINDSFGHQVGDDVLRATGATISATMRDRDIVMRYGGEEFLVAVAGADQQTVLAIAERISANIRALEISDGSGGTIALTTSVGIATWAPSDTLESMIARADRALYAAKAAGRDRCVLEPATTG
jgi:two-component system, cell cycle response regulator